jgi:hypothetical protein
MRWSRDIYVPPMASLRSGAVELSERDRQIVLLALHELSVNPWMRSIRNLRSIPVSGITHEEIEELGRKFQGDPAERWFGARLVD